MNRQTEVAVLLLGVALLAGAPVRAAAPQITSVSPAGVQRGVAGEVTIGGTNLAGHPRLVTPFAMQIDEVDPKRSGAGGWTFKLTAGPEVAIGVYPIRVQTDDGLSNPFLLAVGQLPQVAEKEDNTTFEAAQALPAIPLIVEGQAAGNDVDYFRFAGKKGTIIVVDAQCARIGSGVDPTIRLTTAGGSRRFVASADDSPGLLTDARLVAELPEDTDYVVEISDSRYQGGGRPVYRLLIGPVPMAEEIYPLGGRVGETVGLELRGGTLGGMKIAASTIDPVGGTALHLPRISSPMPGVGPAAGPVRDLESLHPLAVETLPELREPAEASARPIRAAAPVVFNGRIDPPGDEDRFALAVTAGQRLHVAVEAYEDGSALDGVLQVQGASGAVIANADDTPIPGTAKPAMPKTELVSPDPALDVTVPGGTSEMTLVLRDLEGRGGVGFPYRIIVRPIVPTFTFSPNEPQVSIPKGGTAAIPVTVVRKGFDGPIIVTVADPPGGLTIRPGTIAPGQLVGALSISASPDASFTALALKLIGRADVAGEAIEVEAAKPVVLAQQGTLPTYVLTQKGLPAAPALPTPVTLDAAAGPVEVAHGFGASIPIKAERTRGADAALAITPYPLPPGLAVPAATLAEKAATASVAVNTAVEAPLGLMTIALQAKGKFPGGEQTIAIPAVTLSVVRPAELALVGGTVEVKAGATAELKGKVMRKGAFKDPVTIKINGLPAGLKADPVTVAAGAADFALKVVAEAKAPAASAGAQVVPAYQVNKKDYPPAPVPITVKVLPAK
jgi:hypothetical protein